MSLLLTQMGWWDICCGIKCMYVRVLWVTLAEWNKVEVWIGVIAWPFLSDIEKPDTREEHWTLVCFRLFFMKYKVVVGSWDTLHFQYSLSYVCEILILIVEDVLRVSLAMLQFNYFCVMISLSVKIKPMSFSFLWIYSINLWFSQLGCAGRFYFEQHD